MLTTTLRTLATLAPSAFRNIRFAIALIVPQAVEQRAPVLLPWLRRRVAFAWTGRLLQGEIVSAPVCAALIAHPHVVCVQDVHGDGLQSGRIVAAWPASAHTPSMILPVASR
jgi:hypothetical protein